MAQCVRLFPGMSRVTSTYVVFVLAKSDAKCRHHAGNTEREPEGARSGCGALRRCYMGSRRSSSEGSCILSDVKPSKTQHRQNNQQEKHQEQEGLMGRLNP